MKSLICALVMMFAVAACATDVEPESFAIAPSIVGGDTISPPPDWRPGDPFPETLIVNGVEKECNARPVPGTEQGLGFGCWCAGNRQMCCTSNLPPFFSCYYGHVCREPDEPPLH